MTRKLFLIAGVASMALSSPALAERGGNRDRETRAEASQSGKERKAQRSQRTERPQRAERQRAERPQRAERQRMQRPERAQRFEKQRDERRSVELQRFQRAERSQYVERQRSQRVERQRTQRVDRSQRAERQQIQRVERQRVERQRAQRIDRSNRMERQQVERADRQRSERAERRRVVRAERGAVTTIAGQRTFGRNESDRINRRSLRVEPREFRQMAENNRDFARLYRERTKRPMKFKGDRRIVAVGDRVDPERFTNYVPTLYRTRYVDTPNYYYRYDDDLGYLYRIDRDDNYVRSLIPLFGGYGIGDPWPRMYYSSYVPTAYRGYYYDTPDYYYRSDGYGIYQIDAGTQLITALVALLTGQGYGVGQMLPSSYDVYNVPLSYRSTYHDRDDAWYRYGDGFIYEMDPYSRRIEARYPLYADNYLIGEPWPVAYPDYNVPLGYQPLYYDTPQYHYRYANGAIYQVDPTTQVIMALVSLATGQPMSVGQPMPPAYSAYNVPLAYRDRYFDSDDEWYRYADGYIYRVDPYNGLIEDAIPVYA